MYGSNWEGQGLITLLDPTRIKVSVSGGWFYRTLQAQECKGMSQGIGCCIDTPRSKETRLPALSLSSGVWHITLHPPVAPQHPSVDAAPESHQRSQLRPCRIPDVGPPHTCDSQERFHRSSDRVPDGRSIAERHYRGVGDIGYAVPCPKYFGYRWQSSANPPQLTWRDETASIRIQFLEKSR
jgi:hypothetical protein